MTKQKICIIGDGLSGLVSALTINQLHSVEVNLIAKKAPKNVDRRTTAISDSNLKFLRDSIPGLNKKSFWSSKNIELFYETEKERINFWLDAGVGVDAGHCLVETIPKAETTVFRIRRKNRQEFVRCIPIQTGRGRG